MKVYLETEINVLIRGGGDKIAFLVSMYKHLAYCFLTRMMQK